MKERGKNHFKHTIVDSYSKDMPPRVGLSPLLRSNMRVSVGSAIFLISHHKTCPSVEVVKHSVPEDLSFTSSMPMRIPDHNG